MREKKGIPFRISPFFFLTAGAIGYLNSRSLMGTLLWIGVIFVSIFVHEMGHALFSKLFGQSPKVELTALGGVTYANKPRLSLPKEFMVVLAGPLFGFALFVLAWLTLLSQVFTSTIALYILGIFYWINLVWTCLNLLPVLPLDGGQLMRILFEGVFGHKGRRAAFITSMCIALVGGLIFIFVDLFIISILFFMFAFQNFEFARQIRSSTASDEDDHLRQDLAKAENLVMQQRSHEAMTLLEEVRSKAKKGLVYQLATQDLAKAIIAKGDFQEAYDMLKPDMKDLSDTGKTLLQQAAFEVGDFATALSLSGSCLVNLPDGDLLLRAAASAAKLGQFDAAMGWLQTAKDYGCANLISFIERDYFDEIRSSKEFQSFSQQLHS